MGPRLVGLVVVACLWVGSAPSAAEDHVILLGSRLRSAPSR